jgi:hypothetical protein
MSRKEDFHERLSRFISVLGLKPTSFEATLEFSNGSIGKALAEKRAIGSDRLETIVSKFPQLNLTWLLTGKGEMLVGQGTKLPAVAEPLAKYETVMTVDTHGENAMMLVPVKAQAGYIRGMRDPEFVDKLPTISLPRYRNGIYRGFEVDGYSMLTEEGIGLHPTDYVAGRYVERVDEVKDHKVYIIVNDAPAVDDIIIKRCYNSIKTYGWLLCKSDNKSGEYPDVHLEPERIKEIWEWKGMITAYYPNVASTHDRINELESDVAYIKKQLKQ